MKYGLASHQPFFNTFAPLDAVLGYTFPRSNNASWMPNQLLWFILAPILTSVIIISMILQPGIFSLDEMCSLMNLHLDSQASKSITRCNGFPFHRLYPLLCLYPHHLLLLFLHHHLRSHHQLSHNHIPHHLRQPTTIIQPLRTPPLSLIQHTPTIKPASLISSNSTIAATSCEGKTTTSTTTINTSSNPNSAIFIPNNYLNSNDPQSYKKCPQGG